jgi:O-antigen ligase
MSKSFKVLAYPLVALYGAVSALSILGFRGDGPLGGFLNKPTFTIRVDYWQTAINTISNFPLFGVGSDSFGDWFRLMRDEDTVARIGLNVSTNSAHNIVLDMMANTGVLVGLAYLLVVFLILWKSVPMIWNPQQNINPVFLPIFLAWFAYQVQSLVSINQIGIVGFFRALWSRCCLSKENLQASVKLRPRAKPLRRDHRIRQFLDWRLQRYL